MQDSIKNHIPLCLMLLCLVGANIALWVSVRPTLLQWSNVPPTPGIHTAVLSGLGDKQLAYRSFGMTIQNMGDTGGRVTSLKKYDYEALTKWFKLAHLLDPRSDFMPFLAGYFFGGVKDPQKLRHVIDYLEIAAGDGQGQKWRFLGQAAFLARFKMKDLDRALQLANKLSSINNPDMALWARQMPVFILTAQGEKEAAYTLMMSLLKSDAQNLHPNEVNATLDYLCTRILDASEAAREPVCKEHLE